MAALSWRTIADRLAERLEFCDFCDNGHSVIDEGVEVGCPNCQDRAAIREYRNKAGVEKYRDHSPSVLLHEVPVSDPQRRNGE